MLISLRNDHKDHLQLLSSQPTFVVIDFCKLAIDFLQNGPNTKKYSIAAKKLNVNVDVIQNCIYGLVNLLLISCKHKLNEVDFRDSILTAGFSHEHQSILSQFYESKKADIGRLLCNLTVNEPHFHDLQWRFEIQLSSRCLLQQTTPIVTVELTTKLRNNDVKKVTEEQEKEEKQSEFAMKKILLQIDPTNLLFLANELEKALIESRSRHSRKIQKTLL